MEGLVSIIIPVYNVEKYLDQCIESVACQTYKNLEIILVYDKSQDNTIKICRKWEKKDTRILLVINSRRCGLGVARNLGLSMAKGDYIIYLDSDDWLEENFVEKLYKEISRTGMDYVSSRGYYEVDGEKTAINHAVPSGCYSGEWKEILLIADHVCAWKKIYRKKWLEENNLIDPPLFYYEDWGLYPAIIKQAKTISVIDETGVYYRYLREGCLSNDFVSEGTLSDFKKALKYLLNYLDEYNLRKRPDNILAYYCIRDYYCRLMYAKKLKDLEALQSLEDIKNCILVKEFGNFDLEKHYYIAFGSFSLRWEIHKALFHSEYLNKHYCFSSIISAVSKCSPIKLQHNNTFRQEQIENDISSNILDEIKNMGDRGVLFIDLLEERYDLIELNDGQYFTMSDAFVEATKEKISFKRIIEWGSSEYMNLWRKNCLEFIRYLKRYLRKDQVIYVANRMSVYYGDFNEVKKYKQWEYITRINTVLSEMENYFLDHFQGIIKIQPDRRTAFTDREFRLGCDPQYMNNIYYSMVGVEIFSHIKNRLIKK